jgi:hypothetical protein
MEMSFLNYCSQLLSHKISVHTCIDGTLVSACTPIEAEHVPTTISLTFPHPSALGLGLGLSWRPNCVTSDGSGRAVRESGSLLAEWSGWRVCYVDVAFRFAVRQTRHFACHVDSTRHFACQIALPHTTFNVVSLFAPTCQNPPVHHTTFNVVVSLHRLCPCPPSLIFLILGLINKSI